VDLLTPRLIELLAAYGPWLLFGMAVLETSFVTGLIVPSGLATSLATVLALQAGTDPLPLVASALVGAGVGDSMGYWVGRIAGARLASEKGPWGGVVTRKHRELSAHMGRRPFVSVTLARLVSFVRTLMPMAAGMSGLGYRRFLAFDVPGVLAWGVLYVGIGYVARESWLVATRMLGVGGALAMIALGVFLWMAVGRRGPRPGPATREEGR
jgi:undecaprenyl-diphosphatase